MAYIYSIYNNISEKRYIGQTIQPFHKRVYQHFYQAKKGVDTPLYHALRKYPKSNFKIEIVEECDKSLLNQREVYWINYFNTFTNGYNCDIGGAGTNQFKHSEATKMKMSASKKGKTSGRKGKINSTESNKKRSETLKQGYKNGTRKQRDYSDVSGENNGNYKTGKYAGWYARYKKKKSI